MKNYAIIIVFFVFILSLLSCSSDSKSIEESAAVDINGTWDFMFYNVPSTGTALFIDISVAQTNTTATFYNPSNGYTGNGEVHGYTVSANNIELIDGFPIDIIGIANETDMSGTWSMDDFSGNWEARR